MDNLVDIKLVEEWIAVLKMALAIKQLYQRGATYLGNRSCENNDFIELTNSLHKLVYSRSLDHIDVVVIALNFHWYREIGLMQDLHRRLAVIHHRAVNK